MNFTYIYQHFTYIHQHFTYIYQHFTYIHQHFTYIHQQVIMFKKGERSNPANYRPISLTCTLCKTLEHIVASSITKHLSKLNIFYELQHGFREKRSCESQLLMLVDDLFKSVYKKKQTGLILLDFSKAFDPHMSRSPAGV